MTKYTITPWRSSSDLLRVRQQLYSIGESDTDSRRYAVDRIMAWKLRGNLPHAIESTALLVDAILHHDIQTNSIFSIRAVYSAAFCRFVTGFCDIGRHKERTLEPSSMLEIAKKIDMPAEFVALRHEATHEDLPAIRRLMTAARQALDWLWKVYWSRLEESEDSEAVHAAVPAIKNEAAVILRNFRRSRRDALRSKTDTSPQQLGELAETCDSLVDLCKDSRTGTKALADVFVEERIILPGNRELGSSLQGAFLIWDDPLKNLSIRLSDFMPFLVASVCESIAKPATTEPRKDIEKEALTLWLLHLLAFENARDEAQASLHADVIRWCCLYPGYWTRRIGLEVLDRGDRKLQAEWQDLLNASSIELEADEPKIAMLDEDTSLIDNNFRLEGLMEEESIRFEFEEAGSSKAWRRAIISSATPLGIVK